ncbi:transposase [Rhodoplanes serenus]|uniref:transposase n=1 Tax=Rhodoplanes serenus TaxID=200615 RepID=UPI001FE21809|nr:transposase [Rhodoplanes serenus]
MKTGTLIDATIIESASKQDGEARCVGRRGKPAVHGFKAHVGADADTSLVEQIAVTSANVADSKAGPAAVPDDPGDVFADSAYRGRHFSDAVNGRCHEPRRPHRRTPRRSKKPIGILSKSRRSWPLPPG